MSTAAVAARKYALAERFKAPQGEGQFTGTPMAFVRTVGCSVGQDVCTACDTDFLRVIPELGGGIYTAAEILDWAGDYRHVCITGGEPLDRDLRELLYEAENRGVQAHVETSGTKHPAWLAEELRRSDLWLTVSPKPGWLPDVIAMASEVKLIIGGLGDGLGWPTVHDAVRWADEGRLVYVQPRNERLDVDMGALAAVIATVDRYPQLRLSTQLHKFLRTR